MNVVTKPLPTYFVRLFALILPLRMCSELMSQQLLVVSKPPSSSLCSLRTALRTREQAWPHPRTTRKQAVAPSPLEGNHQQDRVKRGGGTEAEVAGLLRREVGVESVSTASSFFPDPTIVPSYLMRC